MRKMILLFMIFLMISCNSEYSPNNEITVDEATDKSMDLNTETESFSTSINSLEALTLSKFQEYLDLVKLLKEHPEFREIVKTQLAKYNPDTILKLNYPDKFVIDRIRMEDIRATSDSTDRVKILFDVVTNNKRLKDSINVTIIKSKLIIDGRETKSSKIFFSE